MVPDKGDTDEGMAASTTEDIGENRLFVGLINFIDPGLKRDIPLFILIKGCIDRTRLRNKLMQLVGQKCIALSGLLLPNVGCADPEQ